MASKDHHEPITNLGWFFLFAFTITIDIAQILLDLAFGAGVIANRIIDVGVAFALLLIFYLKGVSLTPAQYSSICAAFIGEEIPAIDVLPMWTLDVFYIFMSIKGQELAEKAGVAGKVVEMAVKAAKKGQGGGGSAAASAANEAELPPPLPTNTVDLRPPSSA